MPYTDEDRYIRANIRSLLGSLIAAPEAAPSLLNAAQKWNSIYDYGKYLGVSGAAIDSAWNLGGINTASLVKSAIQLRSAGVSTLLKNGLLEELISIEPHTAENILQNIIAHPFIKEQRNTLGMAYLNDQETVECAQLILKLARNLPPKAIAELGNSVANLLEKTPKKEQEASKTNTPSPYQPIIESIVNKTFLEAALDQPKIIEGTILPSLMSYLAEPDSATLKQVVSAITELASQSNVREVLTPVVDHKLINNIFNLPQLKDSPYRTLAYDLAKGEPEQFRKLANAILSSSAQKDLKPITAKLLDFIDLPKIESPENDRVFDDLVLSLVKLIAKPNIKKEVVPILNVELFDNIFNLPQLSESPYGQLIHNLTKNQPEHFQKLASAILTNPFEKELKPVFSKILDFIHLPKVASPKNDKVFDDLVLSLVDLLSKPKVRDKVKPLMTVGLIDDIFDLPQLSDSPYRKLVHDLAEDQPKEFQELFNSMLSSSFLTDLKPFMSSLLEFTRLPSGAPNSDKVFNEFMDSLLSMSAKPPIPAKLALLLTPKTINNLFALPQLKKMSSFKIIAKKTASAISKHPKDIEAMLKTYNDFKHASDNPAKIVALIDSGIATLQNKDVMAALTDVNALTSIAIMLETTAPKPKLNKFTENLRREMPIVLEQEKEGIIAACGEVAYNACKTSADLAAKSTPKETSEGLTTPAKETLIARSKTLSIKDYFDILAEAPTVTHKNIINIVTQNKEKIANAVDLISAKAPNNQVVKLLQNFGINGNDLVYFAEAVCNPAGLKAIGRYVDKPTIPNLARIFIDTNTLSFGIKHLMISYGNYFKELSKGSEVTTTPKTATAPKKRTWEEKINQDSKKTRHISLDKSV